MVFDDYTCHALLTPILGNSDTVSGFGELTAKTTPLKNEEDFTYIRENAKILPLRNVNLDASWSTECRLTQREIFTSFMLDVATFRRFSVATFQNLY